MSPDRTQPPGLVCTVSTVKDTLGNVRQFVSRNLAAGADHMFVFLDDSDPEIHAYLDEVDHVTPVATDETYWQGDAPTNLNVRQVVNANVANVLLAPFPEVHWLFHIDGDECLDIDREALPTPDDDVRAVRLRPLEAVSQPEWAEPVDVFKYPLGYEDLCLLTVLGVIDGPRLKSYFNGHTGGKPGLRPSLDLRLRIHAVTDTLAVRVVPAESDRLNVLHYESYSGEEFVRKWAAHLSSGGARFRQERDVLRGAISSVLENDQLGEERKRQLLMEVYRARVEDDLATLEELGFLVSPDEDHHSHVPAGFPAQVASMRDVLLEHLRVADKRFFMVGDEARHPAELVAGIRAGLGEQDSTLADLLGALLPREEEQEKQEETPAG